MDYIDHCFHICYVCFLNILLDCAHCVRGLLEDDAQVPEHRVGGLGPPIQVDSASTGASPVGDISHDATIDVAMEQSPIRDARISIVVKPQPESKSVTEPQPMPTPATRSGRPQRNRKKPNYFEHSENDSAAPVDPHSTQPVGDRRRTRKEKKAAEASAKDLQDARDRAHAAKQQAKAYVGGITSSTASTKPEENVPLDVSTTSTSSSQSLTAPPSTVARSSNPQAHQTERDCGWSGARLQR